jgi:GMP synthase-like glutamine amidotransferase
LKAGLFPAFLFLSTFNGYSVAIYIFIMRIHCIRHEPFEGLAAINYWIQSNNFQLSFTQVYLGEQFPSVDNFDFLIIMGGSASVYDNERFPWLKEEKKFIQKAISHNKKILGICLGAQLLADALESKVYKGPGKEIGWFPLEFNITGLPGLKFLPENLEVFHWHGDTFDIPEGAICIGSSELIPNQGFLFGRNVIALQFHCEMNVEQLTAMIDAAGHELMEGEPYIQSAKKIMEKVHLITSNNKLMFDFLDYFVQ